MAESHTEGSGAKPTIIVDKRTIHMFLLEECKPINRKWLHEAIKKTSTINQYNYETLIKS